MSKQTKFKETEIGMISEDWHYVKIKDIKRDFRQKEI
jgi:hypothetical protein